MFRRSLLNRLQQEYKDREELRARSLQAWICYVTFICNIFDYLRVRSWSRSTRLLLPRGARRSWASKDAGAGVSDGCCTEPQGHGLAVRGRASSQHRMLPGLVLPTGK